MCRSSRFVCFSIILVAVLGSVGAAARPGIRGLAPHFGAIAPHPLTPAATGGALAGRAARQAQQALRIAAFAEAGGLAQGPRGRVGRRGYGDGGLGYGAFGYGGLGYGGYGYDGFSYAGLGPAGSFDEGPGAEPLVIPAPPPCLPPRVITVGRGLRHRPPTRVTYGGPFCGF